MTTRNARITFAYDYILQHPDTSKRALQAKLKQEYGVGLRDEIVRRVLQEANTPNTLKYRLNTRAFTPLERRELKDFMKRGNPPYLAGAINHRYSAYRTIGDQMKQESFGFRQFIQEFRRIIKKEAGDNGWIITTPTQKGQEAGRRKGMIDVFKMIKDYRDKSIDSGDYVPMPKKKTKTSRGNIKAQKARYGVKQSAKMTVKVTERERNKLHTWISSLDAQLVNASGEKRQRLVKQRAGLEKRLDNLK